MSATPKRLPLTISIMRLMPRPSRAASALRRGSALAAPAPPASQARAPSRVTSPVGHADGAELGLEALDAEPVGATRRGGGGGR